MTVFVSHSKHDIDLRRSFAEISSISGVAAKYMEFEDLQGKYAGFEIANLIRPLIGGMQAVVVLLGENLENPPTQTPEFTHNWVNFEVGVAAGSNKPVWVFEEYGKKIQFPIPYVTNYCLFDPNNNGHVKYYADLFRDIFRYHLNTRPVRVIKCSQCYAEYGFWGGDLEISCPVCRKKTLTGIS